MASAAPVDGVLQLDACAGELVHESFTCDTRDHEDHTCALSHALCPPPAALAPPPSRLDARPGSHRPRRFCGMMFDVQAETGLPMEYVEVSSVSVGRMYIIYSPSMATAPRRPAPASLTANGRT